MTGSNGRSCTRGRIIRLDELTSVVSHSIRTMKLSSSRRLMRLVPVFMLELETHNQTSKEFLGKRGSSMAWSRVEKVAQVV